MNDTYAVQLMSTPVLTVSPDTPVADAARAMRAKDVRSVVVTDDGALAGILTGTDVVRLAADGADPTARAVTEYMATDVATVGPETAVPAAVEVMNDQSCHHLPVVDETLTGILTTTDLMEYFGPDEMPTPVG